MFAAISNFFAAFAALFEGFRIGAESINDVAKIGRVKTRILLDEALQEAGDLTTLNARLESSGITELMARPKIAKIK
jgi:hypothetical protein